MSNFTLSIRDGKTYAVRNGSVFATIDHVMTPGVPASNSYLVMIPVSASVEGFEARYAMLYHGAASFKDLDAAREYVAGIQS